MSRRPDAEEAAHLQYETEHTQPGRPKSVILYLVVLVAAAFVLLLLAYLMQQRTAESVQGLNQSVSSFQTIDQLVADNRSLQEEVTRLQVELARSEDARDGLEARLQSLQTQLAQVQTQLDEALAQLPQDQPSPLPGP